MKKLLICCLALTSLFADVSSIERPNVNMKIGQNADCLESIEYNVQSIVDGLSSFSTIPFEQRQTNVFLNEMHQQLLVLISTLERTNDLLDHLIWIQDHKMSEAGIKKKL